MPTLLPLLPLLDAVIFPRAPAVVHATRKASSEVLRAAARSGDVIGIVTQSGADLLSERAFLDFGCAARVVALRDVDDEVTAIVIAGPLFRLIEVRAFTPVVVGYVEELHSHELAPTQLDDSARSVLFEIAEAILTSDVGERTAARDLLELARHPSDLASICLYGLELPLSELEELLL